MPADLWRWPNFSPEEVACEGSGSILIVPETLDRLQMLRNQVGPLPVSSGYRSPAHNSAVSSTGHDGPHAGRFIHLDDMGNEDTKGPRPTVWSY